MDINIKSYLKAREISSINCTISKLHIKVSLNHRWLLQNAHVVAAAGSSAIHVISIYQKTNQRLKDAHLYVYVFNGTVVTNSYFIHHNVAGPPVIIWEFQYRWNLLCWRVLCHQTAICVLLCITSVSIQVCFTHIHQGSWPGTILLLHQWAIAPMPQCQWSNPEEYGKYITGIHKKLLIYPKDILCIFMGYSA